MFTNTFRVSAVPGDRSGSISRGRRAVMFIDGVFLAVVGAAQVTFELAAYYAGVGPYGSIFDNSPYTIGWVENHALACSIGVLLLTVAARDARRFWHSFALAVHVILAAANLAFWDSFLTFGVAPMGIGATVAHLLLIVAHGICLGRSRRPTADVPAPAGRRNRAGASR